MQGYTSNPFQTMFDIGTASLAKLWKQNFVELLQQAPRR